MLGIFTDDHYFSFSFNNLALLADRFNRCSDFHVKKLLSKKPAAKYTAKIFFKSRKYSYLSLHMILPFVRSYGDISRVTLSPGSILI